MAFDLRGKPLPQRWMIGAIALNFVSQFFLYLDDAGIAGLSGMLDTTHYTQLTIYSFAAVGTGWQLHQMAFLLIPVLALVFLREDFVQQRWFIRFGYWLGVVLLFFTMTPGAPFRGAFGALLGLISLVIAIWAAILHGRAVRAAAKIPPAA